MYLITTLQIDFPAVYGCVLFITFVIGAIITNSLMKFILSRLVGKTETELDDKIILLIKRPVFWSIILFGFHLALKFILFSNNLLEISQKTLYTIIFAVWGIVGISASRLFFQEYKRKNKRASAETMITFLNNIARAGIALLILLVILNLWGIDITPALASAGVIGVAVAFAARDTVANLFGGISVFFDKPYKIGDYVIVNEQHRGEVVEIGMRSTKIKTRDNVLLTVPNSVLVTDAVINETGFDSKLRVRIPLAVAYGSDLSRVEDVLVKLANVQKEIVVKPKPRVRYRNFGESGINLEFLFMIPRPSKRGNITHKMIKKIDETFKKEGLHMPFPQRDVHLYPAQKK